jgi:hypothetical protein
MDNVTLELHPIAQQSHEGFVSDITPLGIAYLADEITGEMFNLPTDELPLDAMPPGCRIYFEVVDRRVINVELLTAAGR